MERLVGKYCTVKQILGMKNPYHYRNKVNAAFARTRKGQIVSGMYEAKSHQVVNIDSCLIEKEVADSMNISQSYISRLEKKILNRLKKEMNKNM